MAEIVAPWTVTNDRMIKPHLYAAAGIPWSLRVELEDEASPEVIAYRLADDSYVEHGRATPGGLLRLAAPFEVEVDPGALRRRPRAVT